MGAVRHEKGFSLIEMMIVITIFSVIMGAVFTTFSTQIKHDTREYRVAESEVELEIVKTLLERDIAMAGYGLADNYGGLGFSPRSAQASNGGADTLTLQGIALGINSRVPQGWSYAITVPPVPPTSTFREWTAADVRENLLLNDRIIAMEPNTLQLITQGTEWGFCYKGTTANLTIYNGSACSSSNTALTTPPAVGTLIYGLDPAATGLTATPYASVRYSLNAAGLPANCAAGTFNLMRSETWIGVPVDVPLLACVRDFQVAFGLDANNTDNLNTIDFWDNGGVTMGGYTQADVKTRLKHVRVYLLVQNGNRDPEYTYPAATVRVGDALLGTGADVALDAEQRRFRWKLVSIEVAPRNTR